MPAIANIVIADAVPTNHTLYPQQAAMALSTWMAREAATYAGNARLAVQMSNPSKTRPTTRVRTTFTQPFERTFEGIVSVPDTYLFDGSFVIPAALSDAEALKCYALTKNLLGNALIQAILANREATW